MGSTLQSLLCFLKNFENDMLVQFVSPKVVKLRVHYGLNVLFFS